MEEWSSGIMEGKECYKLKMGRGGRVLGAGKTNKAQG